MNDELEPIRSAAARRAAELALVRVVHRYGGRPEFVLLGGLVPALLCSNSTKRHAGTSDVDVQVNLEIAGGSVKAAKLEEALLNTGFEPDDERVWRWELNDPDGVRATVKFELLADLDDERNNTTVEFTGCGHLGAANLRGTGSAARDIVIQKIQANDDGTRREAEINVTGLAGFLLAKTAAAHGRRKEKDWYDVAFVLLHNDHGDATAAAECVLDGFRPPREERCALNCLTRKRISPIRPRRAPWPMSSNSSRTTPTKTLRPSTRTVSSRSRHSLSACCASPLDRRPALKATPHVQNSSPYRWRGSVVAA